MKKLYNMNNSNSNNNNNNNREVLQIALGNDSCIVASYLTYLQGLAGTSIIPTTNTSNIATNINNNYYYYCNNRSNDSYCNINTTHSSSKFIGNNINNNNYFYTPRVLFIDSSSNSSNSSSINNVRTTNECVSQIQSKNVTGTTGTTGCTTGTNNNNNNNNNISTNKNKYNWSDFSIETVDQYGQRDTTSTSASASLHDYMTNIDNYDHDYHTNNNNSNSVWDVRYQVQESNNKQITNQKYNVSSNGRHVVWEDDDDDNDDNDNQDDTDNDDDYDYYNRNSNKRFAAASAAVTSSQYHTQPYSSNNVSNNSNSVVQQQSVVQNQNSNMSNNNNDYNCNDHNRVLHWEDDIMRLSPYDRKNSFLYVPSIFHSNNSNNNNNNNNNSSTNNSINDITYHQASSMNGYGGSSTVHSYNKQWNEWKTILIEDKLRHRLEECDSCQGMILLNDTSSSCSSSSSSSIYTGLSTLLLQEMKDECSSINTWNISIDTNCNSSRTSMNNNIVVSTHERHTMIQSIVERGLALHHTVETANVTLPLQLQQQQQQQQQHHNDTLVQVAIALENCTLPFRLHSSVSSSTNNIDTPLIGLHGLHYYGNDDNNNNTNFPFGSINSMNFNEFIKSLQSQSSTRVRRVLELDTYMNHYRDTNINNNTTNLWQLFCNGTSFEHDQRIAQRQNDTISSSQPGNWMLNVQEQHKSNNSTRGILTSLSPMCSKIRGINDKNTSTTTSIDRSNHYHFAIATSFRPSTAVPNMDSKYIPNNQLSSSEQYVSAMMQSIGIRYRPESLSVTVVPQSLGHMLPSSSSSNTTTVPSKLLQTIQEQQQSTLSVLGNTTRRYNYLNDIVNELKNTFKSGTADRGYYQRQVELNILPEYDDCIESIESCYDIRDAYIPPNYDNYDDNCITIADDF